MISPPKIFVAIIGATLTYVWGFPFWMLPVTVVAVFLTPDFRRTPTR